MNTYLVTIIIGKVAYRFTELGFNSGQAKQMAMSRLYVNADAVYAELKLRGQVGSKI